MLSFSQLKSLLFALENFPEKTPLRWSLVAKYVHESKFEDKTRIRVGGSPKSKSGEAEELAFVTFRGLALYREKIV